MSGANKIVRWQKVMHFNSEIIIIPKNPILSWKNIRRRLPNTWADRSVVWFHSHSMFSFNRRKLDGVGILARPYGRDCWNKSNRISKFQNDRTIGYLVL